MVFDTVNDRYLVHCNMVRVSVLCFTGGTAAALSAALDLLCLSYSKCYNGVGHGVIRSINGGPRCAWYHSEQKCTDHWSKNPKFSQGHRSTRRI